VPGVSAYSTRNICNQRPTVRYPPGVTILAGSFPGIHGLLHHATGLEIIGWGAGGGLAVVLIQILTALGKNETVWPWHTSGKPRYLVRSLIWIALSTVVAVIMAINADVSAFLSGIGGVGFLLLLTR
jgi:hypothetical protein